MRVLIIFAALVLLFALIGWITFSNDQGRSSINLEKTQIREDTGELMHEGSELLNEAEKKVAPNDNRPPEPTAAP
jgi:hypothetical protein